MPLHLDTSFLCPDCPVQDYRSQLHSYHTHVSAHILCMPLVRYRFHSFITSSVHCPPRSISGRATSPSHPALLALLHALPSLPRDGRLQTTVCAVIGKYAEWLASTIEVRPKHPTLSLPGAGMGAGHLWETPLEQQTYQLVLVCQGWR